MCEDIHRQAKGEQLNEIDHFLEDAEGLFNEVLAKDVEAEDLFIGKEDAGDPHA